MLNGSMEKITGKKHILDLSSYCIAIAIHLFSSSSFSFACQIQNQYKNDHQRKLHLRLSI